MAKSFMLASFTPWSLVLSLARLLHVAMIFLLLLSCTAQQLSHTLSYSCGGFKYGDVQEHTLTSSEELGLQRCSTSHRCISARLGRRSSVHVEVERGQQEINSFELHRRRETSKAMNVVLPGPAGHVRACAWKAKV